MTEWKTVYSNRKTNSAQSSLAQRVRQGCTDMPPPPHCHSTSTLGWVNLYQTFEIEKYTVCSKLILPKKWPEIL